ncbi:hypothetical protein Esti_005445 [Eimeria stiedai]
MLASCQCFCSSSLLLPSMQDTKGEAPDPMLQLHSFEPQVELPIFGKRKTLAALEKQRRLPNRALRVGSCAAPLPPTNSSISSSSGCGFYGYMGDFVLRRCANGGFHLTPPFPAHSNPSLQQQQQQQRSTRRQQQIYKNVEYRDVVCLLPKPWGPEGPWGVETSRLVHRKKGKPPIHPVPKPATLLPH